MVGKMKSNHHWGTCYTSGRKITCPPPMEFRDWYTTTQLAKLLRVSRLSILRLHKNGKLLPTTWKVLGKRRDRRYSAADVRKFLNEPE